MVMFHAINLLSGDGGGLGGRCGPQVQECWEFEHPRKDGVLDARGTKDYLTHFFGLLTALARASTDKQS